MHIFIITLFCVLRSFLYLRELNHEDIKDFFCGAKLNVLLFPYSRLFKIRMQRLLLDIFIQIGSRLLDTVPVGTGIIK